MSARQDLLRLAGGGEGALGTAIVRLLEEALASNREEVLAGITENNRRIAEFQETIGGFASRDDLEHVAGDVAAIQQLLSRVANAWGGALELHNQAVADASPANVEAAQVATDEAEQAGNDVDARIESLETRVSELETWRAEHVDPTLEDHAERISALENRAEPIVIAQPDPGPVPAALLPDEPEPAPVVNANPQPTRGLQAARDANPANWEGPVPWVVAAIGLIIGWVFVGELLNQASQPVLWDWIAWLFKPVAAAVGFFGGGLIGHRLTQRQPAARPAEA